MTTRYLVLSLIASALVGGLCWYGFGWDGTWPAVVCAWLIGANAVAFALYGFDKRRAVVQGRRVPETALLSLAAAGGSIGAYAGMGFFRHKTLKGSFRALFWLIVSAQVVLLVWLLQAGSGPSRP
jgi:uncharacterized membrane protein YsdA (DUF1294 family)